MPKSFSGECACGAIRYECTAEPLTMFHCHCRDCQRASGGPYSSVVVVPREAFKFTQGSPRFYSTPSTAGGHLNRGFCAECGSPILGKPDPDSAFQFVGILASSVDDPSWFKPQMHIWTSEAQPWHLLNPTVPHFEQYAP